MPRSRFLGDLNFRGTFANSGGTHQIHQIFTCIIEYSFPEISVHFYLNLSSMSIILPQEGVQITVKYVLIRVSFGSKECIIEVVSTLP